MSALVFMPMKFRLDSRVPGLQWEERLNGYFLHSTFGCSYLAKIPPRGRTGIMCQQPEQGVCEYTLNRRIITGKMYLWPLCFTPCLNFKALVIRAEAWDPQPVRNTIKQLVSTMVHPMARPSLVVFPCGSDKLWLSYPLPVLSHVFFSVVSKIYLQDTFF